MTLTNKQYDKLQQICLSYGIKKLSIFGSSIHEMQIPKAIWIFS